MITQEELKKVLHYNENSGVFTWIKCARHGYDGRTAGTLDKDGYVQIKVFGKYWKAHRLAWIYCYGSISDDSVDHKNGNKQDNSIKNLRLCSHAENNANAKLSKRNKYGVKGVEYTRGGYTLKIGRCYIGRYKTLEEAKVAYDIHSRRMYGGFARNDGS